MPESPSDPPGLPAPESRESLIARVTRFYLRYGPEVENLRRLVDVQLNQLCLAYALDNRLPREALTVRTRVKPLESFLDKLERKGWPHFYYPTEVVEDLIGARVVCWFVADCQGLLRLLHQSHLFAVRPHSVEDYITHPKASGYRSIHVLADFTYDGVRRLDGHRALERRQLVCEIQLRTKLQDAFAEMTHEFPYKHRDDATASTFVAEARQMADVLQQQEDVGSRLRALIQKSLEPGKREGLRGGPA